MRAPITAALRSWITSSFAAPLFAVFRNFKKTARYVCGITLMSKSRV